MAIQVVQITGDTVELVFNPAEDNLRVGDNLSIVGCHENHGLIVQLIELKAIFSEPSLPSHHQPTAEAPQSASRAVTSPLSRTPRRRKTPLPAREIQGLHLATARIRKMTDPAWHPWDGWIPIGGVSVTRVADREVLRRCIPESGHPLWLGKTLTGEPFHIDRVDLGTVNLIVGAKGAGASGLARVIVNELIDHGVRCVVFDTTGAYARLSSDSEHSSIGSKGRPAIVHLIVGESLKLGLLDFGLNTLLEMLKLFGLPKAVALYFESHVARRLMSSKGQEDADRHPLFLGIDAIMRLAQDLEAEGHAVVGGAIVSCLEAINKTQVFASQAAEARKFWDGYAQIRHGGALVIDLSRLPRRARTSIVSSIVGVLRDIAERDIATESSHSPVMFFDDARALFPRHFIADVLIPARPLGLTSFFVTTIATRLEDYLLHEADNLFLREMASDDVYHLAKSGLVDVDSLRGIVRCLQESHSLVIGRATWGYPIIFAVNPQGSIEPTAEESAFTGATAAVPIDPPARTTSRFSTRLQTSAGGEPSLPLFPDDTPARAVPPEPRDDEPIPATAPPPTPTVAQVTAMWDHLVKRVGRRRRILETILSTARPVRVAERRLVLSFPPQHSFQQELVESEEYRSLVEEELKKAFGVSLEVTTEVYPA